MQINTRTHNRKAISPVLATVILIAITLIAAIAIAGFVFGLFGTFTKTATVVGSTVSCTDGTPGVCTVVLTNTGTGNTATAGTCTESYGGATWAGTITHGGGTIVAGGAGVSATCTVVAPPALQALNAGQSVTGSIALTNGGSVLFSGTG